MTDTLGYRMKFGVIAPSTNTSVQPEFDDMRPVGVTNHFSRILIPDMPVRSDEDFNNLVMGIRAATMDAIDAVKTCSPGALIMGMSAAVAHMPVRSRQIDLLRTLVTRLARAN